MWQGEIDISSVVVTGAVSSAAVALLGTAGWLAGLAIVIKGAAPRDRPAILRAYATCRPWRQPADRAVGEPPRPADDGGVE